MSSSRLPSPEPNGGRTAQGVLNGSIASQSHSRSTSQSPSRRRSNYINGFKGQDVDAQWPAAQKRSQQVRRHPVVQTKNEGFFKRTRRQISLTLPTFETFGPGEKNWQDQEKLGRGRWSVTADHRRLGIVRTYCGNVLRKFKFLFVILGVVALLTTIMSQASTSREETR